MKKGFTLIELLVVITIIGILAVGGISVYDSQIKKARDSTNIKNLKILNEGLMQYVLDHGEAVQSPRMGNELNAKHLRDSLIPYIPNIYDIKHSAKSKFGCEITEAEETSVGCIYRYRVKRGTDEYKVYSRLESKSNICVGCLTRQDGGIWVGDFELGTNVKLNSNTSDWIGFLQWD